jgi:L-serine dehydratase
MSISVFDLYTIGIGPSSSHTVGPMRASRRFARELESRRLLDRVCRVRVTLYGSLGLTGLGHGSDKAVLMGLEGESPEGVDPDRIPARADEINACGSLRLMGRREIGFDREQDLVFDRDRRLAYHPNGLHCVALDAQGHALLEKTYFSVGGGFVVCEGDTQPGPAVHVRYPFASSAELMERCAQAGIPISQLMLENEQAWRSEPDIRAGLLRIWKAMEDCIKRGCRRDGRLPGPLAVRRRAAQIHGRLMAQGEASLSDPLSVMDWVNLYAIAVNADLNTMTRSWGYKSLIFSSGRGISAIIGRCVTPQAAKIPGI